MRAGLIVLMMAAVLGGCTPADYRRRADRETYTAIRQHDQCPAWYVPHIGITPGPGSRLYDPFNPDRPPMPPDDPAAHCDMLHPDGHPGYRHWDKYGHAPFIEDPAWRGSLTLNDKGVLVITPDKAIELGLRHSREYQAALEALYETALILTLQRFEFDMHWFSSRNLLWTHFGSGADEQNTLQEQASHGFTKTFLAGGQLMVDFANTIVFQFAGPDSYSTSSNILITFMQPLLRQAGRQIVLEALTQAERNVLYAVRTFARFRKQFYVNVTTGPAGFLSLLLQVQNIRNLEANQESYQQNLQVYEALRAGGMVSEVQVDETFQRVQQTRANLIRAQTELDNTLDAFKLTLGLPPDIKITLDDAQLKPFELVDPALVTLQGDVKKLFTEYRGLNAAPPLPRLRDGFERLKALQARTVLLADKVGQELRRWQGKQGRGAPDQASKEREHSWYERVAREYPDTRAQILDLGREIDRAAASLFKGTPAAGWKLLLRQLREETEQAAELYILQTQTRVYLIELKPMDYQQDTAIQYAVTHRLDLMNERGRVVDAWRAIFVAANQLKADLNLTFNGNLATLPAGKNPLDFRSSQSSYSVGVQFNAPLNRKAERNTYRQSLINYESERRTYMALDDTIRSAVLADLRNLKADRLSFEIARQSLESAARAVESANQSILLGDNPNPAGGTLEVLTALDNLLTAKTTLIGSWVSYERDRMQLLLDLEELELDNEGLYHDEHDHQSEPASVPGTEQPTGADLPPPRQAALEFIP